MWERNLKWRETITEILRHAHPFSPVSLLTLVSHLHTSSKWAFVDLNLRILYAFHAFLHTSYLALDLIIFFLYSLSTRLAPRSRNMFHLTSNTDGGWECSLRPWKRVLDFSVCVCVCVCVCVSPLSARHYGRLIPRRQRSTEYLGITSDYIIRLYYHNYI